jgi:hypothetical protein
MTKTTKKLTYTESRLMGRNISSYISFFNESKDGKSVIYKTSKGDIWSPAYAKKMIQAAKEEGRREASEEALAFGLYCSSIAIDNTEFEEVLKSFSKGKGASHAIREYERYIKSLNKDS